MTDFPQPHRINAFAGASSDDIKHAVKLIGVCGDLFLSQVQEVAKKYRAAVGEIIDGVRENIPLDQPRPRKQSFEYGLLDIVDDFEKQLFDLTHDTASDILAAIEDKL